MLESPGLRLPERRADARKIPSEVFAMWQKPPTVHVKLLATLLEQTYISRIGEYGGERITYVAEQIDGDRPSFGPAFQPDCQLSLAV